jgi:hypothetical protein
VSDARRWRTFPHVKVPPIHRSSALFRSYLHQKEQEKELTHGHNASHKETNSHGIVKLAHNHGSANAEDAQHGSGPKAGKAFGYGTRAHDGKGHDHECRRHAQDRVPEIMIDNNEKMI